MPAPDRRAHLRQRDRRERAALHADVEHRAEPLAEAREPLGVVDAEYRAHDDLERDRLGARAQAERLGRPASARSPRRRSRCISVAVALHPLAVERGQHQLALAHVLGAVEQQHGVAAHQRLQRSGVRLAGMEGVGVAREDLLDHLRGRR